MGGLGGKIKAQYTKNYKDLLKAASSKRSGLDMFAFNILVRGIALFLAGASRDDMRKIRNHCLKHKMILYKQNRVSLLKDPEPSELPQPAEAAPPSPVSSAAPTTPATELAAPVTPAGSEVSTDSWWGAYAPEWLGGTPETSEKPSDNEGKAIVIELPESTETPAETKTEPEDLEAGMAELDEEEEEET